MPFTLHLPGTQLIETALGQRPERAEEAAEAVGYHQADLRLRGAPQDGESAAGAGGRGHHWHRKGKANVALLEGRCALASHFL